MAHEITLYLAAGGILHMRAVPNGIDVTAFDRKHLQQRIVFGAIVAADSVRVVHGNCLMMGTSNAFVPVTPAEATSILAFVALAKVVA
ncbi:hypothetical protein J2X57_002002 [Luteibacter sp. 1214]|uniref:hypothetical protein n=1 Tax=Luteibacter sp. 1214 TaxID=2817735 RepID=UPI0028671B68|nr:hypothetical protein [Luteibacter sp. 1214]MDR6642790.1 hypothetical protein [Luteibacter sp. 1214]